MLSKEVKETSRTANVRIYVEQAIKRMKKFMEPFDQVIADRGFKIQNDLLSHSATLCIPPSVTDGYTDAFKGG